MRSKNPSPSTSAFLNTLFEREKAAVAGAPSPAVAAVVGAVAAVVGADVVGADVAVVGAVGLIVGAVVVIFVVVVDDIADVVASVDVPRAFEAATKEEDLNF